MLIALSILLVLTALIDPVILKVIGLPDQPTRATLGVLSGLVLFLSLLQSRVDWKQQAADHSKAREILISLKTEGRQLSNEIEGTHSERSAKAWVDKTYVALQNMTPIPERQFHNMKARHLEKLALSRMIEEHPGAPLWILRLQLRRTGIARIVKDSPRDDGPTVTTPNAASR
jgi:hypothetical protein